jgi:hypothetical protein
MINPGPSSTTSVGPSGDPGGSVSGPPPQSTTVVPLPGSGEGEPQDPAEAVLISWVEQVNQTREALGLEPLQTVILPGGAVVNGQVVPVMGAGGPPPAPIEIPPGLGGPPIPGVVNPFVATQGTYATPEQQEQMANTAHAVVTHGANIGIAYLGSSVVGGPVGVAIVATWGAGSTLLSGGTGKEAGVSAAVNVATFNLNPAVGEGVSVVVSPAINKAVDTVAPYLEPKGGATSSGTGQAQPPLHK